MSSELSAAGKAILRPNVYSLVAFAAAVVGPTGTGAPWALRLALDDAASELARQGRIRYFRRVAETGGFLDAAEGFLGEVLALGVTPDELGSVEGGPRTAKLAACAELYAAVAARTGAIESPPAAAARQIERSLPAPFDCVRSVFVDGFTSFTPVEWRLIAALARHSDVWVALPAQEGGRPDAFATIEDTRQRLITLAESASDRAATEPRADSRPAGLTHLQCYLFGPVVPPPNDASGLHLIEAPGPLGEARLVARRVRTLLAAGVRPAAIVVTARDLTYSFDLFAEVFAEYGLPVDLDGGEAVLRNPAVGTLLRALRLPDDDWPFAAVTGLLRSTYFRPEWPEAMGDTARRAEGLLRLLGEPRGREAYLRAVRVWAETPPDGLEDEQAEESRRLRKARLAAECRPFLDRFFRAWDALPAAADPRAFAAAVREFAREIGLDAAAAEVPADRAAVGPLLGGAGRVGRPPDAPRRAAPPAHDGRGLGRTAAVTAAGRVGPCRPGGGGPAPRLRLPVRDRPRRAELPAPGPAAVTPRRRRPADSAGRRAAVPGPGRATGNRATPVSATRGPATEGTDPELPGRGRAGPATPAGELPPGGPRVLRRRRGRGRAAANADRGVPHPRAALAGRGPVAVRGPGSPGRRRSRRTPICLPTCASTSGGRDRSRPPASGRTTSIGTTAG